MEANLVIYDVGSTFTKVSAFSMIDSSLALLARGQVPTTVEDIQSGIANANEIDQKQWDSTGAKQSYAGHQQCSWRTSHGGNGLYAESHC